MITQERIDTNILRLKLNKHTNRRRLKYWIKEKVRYAIHSEKKGFNEQV